MQYGGAHWVYNICKGTVYLYFTPTARLFEAQYLPAYIRRKELAVDFFGLFKWQPIRRIPVLIEESIHRELYR